MRPTDHAASIYTPEELLCALVAERLDRLADRMVYRGLDRLAVFGRRAHVEWLHERVRGMRAFPIRAYVACPGDEAWEAFFRDAPVLRVDDPTLPDHADAVLIADDRHEEALAIEALKRFPPGVIVHRLYERLGIGAEPLPSPEPTAAVA